VTLTSVVVVGSFVGFNNFSYMSFQIDNGTTDTGTLDARSLMLSSGNGDTQFGRLSATHLVEGLSEGPHVFTAKYRSSNPSAFAEFDGRSMVVMPLP
jgi:hypothetical protein